jgi:hypothetical protein
VGWAGGRWSHDPHAWLATQRHWLQVERLPAYAPEPNAVEYLWANLKGVELANSAGDTVIEVADAAGQGSVRRRFTPWDRFASIQPMTALADGLVPDELWALVEPLLPVPPRPLYGGRRRAVSDRACFAAIVFLARTSTPWRLLPARELGCGSPV